MKTTMGYRRAGLSRALAAVIVAAGLLGSLASLAGDEQCAKVIANDERSWVEFFVTKYPGKKAAGAQYYRVVVAPMPPGATIQGNSVNGYVIKERIGIGRKSLCVIK